MNPFPSAALISPRTMLSAYMSMLSALVSFLIHTSSSTSPRIHNSTFLRPVIASFHLRRLKGAFCPFVWTAFFFFRFFPRSQLHWLKSSSFGCGHPCFSPSLRSLRVFFSGGETRGCPEELSLPCRKIAVDAIVLCSKRRYLVVFSLFSG